MIQPDYIQYDPLGKGLQREETLGVHYGLLLLVWASPLRQPRATGDTNEWKHWASGMAWLCLIKDWDIIINGTDLEEGSELKKGRERLKERHDLESTKGIRRERIRGLFVSQWDARTKITLERRSIIQNDWPQVSSINHLNSMWMQKTDEIHLQGQSAFQTAVSLCICRRTEHQQSGRRRVMAGPSGSQNSATPQSRQHQRSVGSEEKKNERRGPRGSDSHIPQSPVYQGHTCPPSLPLLSASVHQSLTLPKCQGRDLGDSANSTPRLVGRGHKQRAEKGEKGTEGREWGLNGTVWKTHLNWRLFCNVLFFLGICEGEGQEGGEV